MSHGTKTSETQTRLLRWSRIQNLAVGMALVGIVVPVVTVGVLALGPQLNSDQSIAPFIWSIFGTAAVLLVTAAFVEIHAQDRIREITFAAGYRSVGMVVDVIEEPASDVGGMATFTLMIAAELPGQLRIRRKLYSSQYPAGAGIQIGQAMIIRHVTVDPDDLGDVQFVRFAGTGQKERG